MDTEYREASTSITKNDNLCTVTGNRNNYRNINPNENIAQGLLLRTFQVKI